jgi:hypothetical protein
MRDPSLTPKRVALKLAHKRHTHPETLGLAKTAAFKKRSSFSKPPPGALYVSRRQEKMLKMPKNHPSPDNRRFTQNREASPGSKVRTLTSANRSGAGF